MKDITTFINESLILEEYEKGSEFNIPKKLDLYDDSMDVKVDMDAGDYVVTNLEEEKDMVTIRNKKTSKKHTLGYKFLKSL